MNYRALIALLVALLLLSLISIPHIQAQEPEPLPPSLLIKIDPRLLKELTLIEKDMVPIIIEMKAATDLSVTSRMASTTARRQSMVTALQTTANVSQVGVQAVLADAQSNNQAADVHPLWIVNAVAAKTTLTTVVSLAARNDVALVRLDETITLPPYSTTKVARPRDDGPEWGVAQIKADEVWRSLGFDGSDVVVANIDTGVDYLHPDLQARYRGYQGGFVPPLHYGNWHDATGAGAIYPVDGQGHGTHTMGTMVGENGIGVAPGAQWIAVRAFNSNGVAQESWLHNAFQWILAPEGDPALAPDVVNNSWGNPNGSSTIFAEDVQHLLDAGIIPIFSAGNSGPHAGTVGSPGSFDYAFAVGATDLDDVIAYFSSRGPSPWGKTKPEVVAPGVNILSAQPGGGYSLSSGTSMAAPHVSGLVALLLHANNRLTYTQISQLLMDTAAPLGDSTPNNSYGRGLANAYNAAQTTIDAGQIVGVVTNQNTTYPIANADILITPRHVGYTGTTTTNANGFYRRGVANNDYNVTASAFGYASQTKLGVVVIAGGVITRDFALLPLPTGLITGSITEAESGRPLSATIIVNQTPITATANPVNGEYTLTLPAGRYTLTILSSGHRVGRATGAPVIVGQTTRQDFSLPAAPTILLVDSGPWHNASEINIYQQALDDLDYYYDTHRIKFIPDDTPVSSTLKAYDVVIWSAPFDSPGYISADRALKDYLDAGGKLFLSGQEIAFFDGGGIWTYLDYYYGYLKSRFVADNANSVQVQSLSGEIFDGLNFTISGGNGANNQNSPDVIRLLEPDFAAQILAYGTSSSAGHRIGHCLPYRAINLPFGFEGINQQDTRAQLLNASLNWFQSPPVANGISVSPITETQVADFGGTVTHAFRLRNEAEVGSPQSFTLTLGSHNWTVNFPYAAVVLEPCQSAWLTFTVDIPANVPWNAQDILTIAVKSTTSSTVITRVSKAPSPVLLVDDDRWYDYEDKFIEALVANGIRPDYWSVQGETPLGSPPLSTLQRYPMIIWFTGYDWFNPLTPEEEATLQQYLDGGGRLFFSSQEYLYKLPDHKASQFAQDYFGVLTHTEYITSSMATGAPGSPVGNDLKPYPLTFPPGYKNWTDSLTPTATARPAMVGQGGLPNALTHHGGFTETWHTAFFAFGPELLANDDRVELMRRVVGWLSWLGVSGVDTKTQAAISGDIISYTAVLRNDGLSNIAQAVFTATFPPPLNLIPGSATGGSEQGGSVVWNGSLVKDQAITLTYQALVNPNTSYGVMSRQVSWFSHPEHNVAFDRVTTVPVNIANWSDSTLTVTATRVALDNALTYTLRLVNTGLVDAPLITVTADIPAHLLPLSISRPARESDNQGTGTFMDNQLIWKTPVSRNQALTLTFSAQIIAVPYPFTFPLTFVGDDGFSLSQWSVETWVKPYSAYLPLIFK